MHAMTGQPPLFERFDNADANFRRRWPAGQPVCKDVRLQILLYAGREAAASFHVASLRKVRNGCVVGVAEQAMLYEPFGYWDWHGYDAKGKPLDGSRDVREGARKKRLLWERERAFTTGGQKHGNLTPRERWEGFKRLVEKDHRSGKFVKRIAVANWMTREDMKWSVEK